ncbi:hypothetical protein SLEP1_g52833 [Rubroshorea leprosula]|uniref:AAA+ ATPase domain-containing protein n=1 Tax=Rubroshorea leprosula TaxID=152421 RepID=A0AAV5M9S7_9ROSI|nr:hypothetical protein SLEP1_g52833 [Rubroshorea leprosula]
MPAKKCIARDEVQEEILQLLRGDKVTRIAVCGMGGMGKTTIMKQVHNQLLKEPTIKKVIWVKVSKDFDIVLQRKRQFDILKFQKNIARKLGLDLNEDEDAIELVGRISQSLQQGSCVLILDDVWEPFSLEDVGILDPNGNDACKMVLTTRSQEVARKMQCKEIYVKPLQNDEALTLFLDKVGSEVVSYPRYKSDIEPFLNQILKKCNSLPLAIGVVANTMRGKSDRYLWERAYKEGQSPYLHPPFICFPWNPVSGFLAWNPKTGFLAWNPVRVPARGTQNWVPREDASMALEELPEEVEGRKNLLTVSLMKNQIREFPSSMLSPKCPMLTTFLSSKNNITTIPEAFFDHMPGLKILDLSGSHKLHRLPSSVSKLESLTTLLLENCESLEEVPILSNLGDLKRLNLYGTSIKELPQGLNMLTNLKYLWLSGMFFDIPDGLLRNLSKLQCLGVDGTIPLKWEEIGRLRKLESLDGRLSTLDDMSLFVKSERKFLNHYRIFVGSCSPHDYYFYNKSFLNVMKSIVCSHIDICEGPNWFPYDAQGFYILDCKDVRSLDDISGFQEATDLRHYTVDQCDGLEFVVSSCCLKSLQNLESLYLRCLKKLNAVVGAVKAVAKSAPLPVGTFSSLQKIEVRRCGKIKKVLSLRLLQYLQILQTINVRWCGQMEEIIWSEYEEGEKALDKCTLPKLERVILLDLPTLKSIYSGFTTILICDSLKRIEIQSCPEIESVFWTGFNPLPTLEHLKLSGLKKLKFVFDEEVLGLLARPTNLFSLKTIQTIQVDSCDQMEELISSSTYEEKEALEKITLPKLRRLELSRLPELKSICNSSNVLICDSIIGLLICDCIPKRTLGFIGMGPIQCKGCPSTFYMEQRSAASSVIGWCKCMCVTFICGQADVCAIGAVLERHAGDEKLVGLLLINTIQTESRLLKAAAGSGEMEVQKAGSTGRDLKPAVEENRMCRKPAKPALHFRAGSTEETKCAEFRKAGCRNGVRFEKNTLLLVKGLSGSFKPPLLLLVESVEEILGAFEQKYGASTFCGGSGEHGFRDLVWHTMFEKDKRKPIEGIDPLDVL